MINKQYYEPKNIVEKLCLEGIQDQKDRESTVGYGKFKLPVLKEHDQLIKIKN
jgi:hypothetical protein